MAVRTQISASEALREVAARDPDRPALEVGDERVTYGELDAACTGLASALVDRLGPGRHHVVHSIEGTKALLVASLGLWRAGLVSVPVDPTAPDDLLQRICADVDAPLILSDRASLDGLGLEVLDPLQLVGAPPGDWEDVPPGEYVAIAFTSGSTGEPKGIVISPAQRALTTTFAVTSAAGTGDAPRRGLIATGSNNPTETGLHTNVAAGATVVAYEVRREGTSGFADWLRKADVAALPVPPTLLRHLMATLGEGDVLEAVPIYIGGETSTWEDVVAIRRHLSRNSEIVSIYGSVETGVALCFVVSPETPLGEGPLPLGVPYPDRIVELLDEDGLPVREGEVGEIAVTNTQTALGYWKRPEETEAGFSDLGEGLRRVRTGDLGRLLPDGNIEFHGRIGHMVKIAGNRVELGQIESTLRLLEGVADAAARTYVDDVGELRLTASVVAADGCALHPSVLRLELARRLPAPMLPDGISVLPELPRLPGGKVDRLQLPVARALPRESSVPPATDLERVILRHWERVLGVKLGVEDDFFAVGGDSLRGARIITAIDAELGLELPVSVLVEAPTVRQLAALVEAPPSASPLVLARSGGDGPPLFLVHDLFGEVVYAHTVASRLPAGFPVYGIRGQAVEGRLIPEDSVQELASRYVEAIRAVRPHGPYFFYGWSAGGTIAFEMASQLRREGENVPVLVLGDSAPPGVPMGSGLGPRRKADLRWREMQRMSRAAAARYALRLVAHQLVFRAYRLAARLTGRRLPPAEYGAAESVMWKAVADGAAVPPAFRGTLAAYLYGGLTMAYAPDGLYDGPLTILACSKSSVPVERWNDVLAAPYTEISFAGGHLDLGSEAGFKKVAETLAQEIRALSFTLD